MEKIYDLIIIGSGPAGLGASIYAQRAELDFIILEKVSISGGQILSTYEVENYMGFSKISGFELGTKFREHADSLLVKFEEGEVNNLTLENELKWIHLEDGRILKTKTIIIATGAKYKKLLVKGEDKLMGMGVSYCATCDGAFFRGREVAVIGGGDVSIEDAIYLSRICKKVYVIHRRNEFRAAKTLVSKLISLENVEVIWDSVVEEIKGDDCVENLVIKNILSEENKEIEVSGVFIAIGTTPNSEMFNGIIDMNDNGYIIAGEDCKTNVEGIYAAGDIRTKKLRQVITAASDGANAVTSVEEYLNK